jgi:hypothetical protein
MYGIAKITKITQVDIVQATQEIIKTNYIYDVTKYKLKSNIFDDTNIIEDKSLTNYQIRLVSNNLNSKITSLGQTLEVELYFYIVGDSEILTYNINGSLYSNKMFAIIDNVQTISGFNKNSTKLNIGSISQPSQGSRFTTNYSYIAPKKNERISITYNYNKAVIDATLAIENNRFTNQDILAKAAEKLIVDITVYIVILQSYISSTNTIKQNVYNAISTASSLTNLAAILDSSDVVNACYSITGIDRVRITHFNLEGVVGNVDSIISKNNQYIAPGIINVNVETR